MNIQEKDSPKNLQADSSSRTGRPGPPAGRRRRWPWIIGLAVMVLAASLFWMRKGAAESAKNRSTAGREAAARAVPVTGAVARVAHFGVYLEGLGTVMPVKTVTIRTRVDGQLVKVDYKEGQLIREGDLLAEIDPRPFEVQLQQAEGQMAKDQAGLANARIDLKRYEALIQDNSIPRQQLDTQTATVNQYEAALKSDQAQIDSAKLNLTYSRITAPISGIVGLRLVDPGNIVHAGDQTGLLVITQQQPITAIFTVVATNLPQILQQMRSGRTLAVEAWSQDSRRKIADGSVLALDNQIDQATDTIRIKALFANDDFSLYPNQIITAKLLVDTLRGAVIVPTAAIQRSPQSTFVFVVKPDQTVEIRNVDIQLTQGNDTSLRQGVAAGETVVIDGVDKLQTGTRVALAGTDGAPKKRPS
jgi:multidrug efflux system membrane fusion protein